MNELLVIPDNTIIVDWLSVSITTSGISYQHIIELLGMRSCNWLLKEGSFRQYAQRLEWGKITIHFTSVEYESIPDSSFNTGCLLEMSGQGCREYESFGRGDWALLIHGFIELRQAGVDVRFTRIDIAYDDFHVLLPIETIAMQAQKLEFTAIPKMCSVTYSMDKHDIDHIGQSIVHGSRSSNTLLRIYNKRVERKRYDLPHWVRAELQLRRESAERFLELAAFGDFAGLGDLFAGIVRKYIQYRIPNDDDNSARWPLAPWYDSWLLDVERISLWTKKDVEYNKSRMDSYAYTQNCNHTIAEIQMDGITEYLKQLYCAATSHNQGSELPDKYKAVVYTTDSEHAQAFAASGCRLPDFRTWLLALRDQIDHDLQTYTIEADPPVSAEPSP